jgi:hypothetical protein
MPSELLRRVAERYSSCHALILDTASRIEGQRYREAAGPPSLRLDWQLWHVARWTETYLAELFKSDPALGEQFGAAQIWEREDIPARWSLIRGGLGMVSAGTGLTDAEAAELMLGPVSEVVDYARRVFDRADAVLRAAVEQPPTVYEQADVPPAVDLILYLDHDNRHLGMVEAIVGLLGGEGSADG